MASARSFVVLLALAESLALIPEPLLVVNIHLAAMDRQRPVRRAVAARGLARAVQRPPVAVLRHARLRVRLVADNRGPVVWLRHQVTLAFSGYFAGFISFTWHIA